MSERIVRAVREEPRRGIGFAVVVAALIAAVLVLVTGLASASGAAPKRAHVVAEGAGALALAAALAGQAGTGKVVCVVSGGNINPGKLSEILQGGDS